MCAIVGSNNFQRFIELIDLNKIRGNLTFGGLFVSADRYHVIKLDSLSNINEKLKRFSTDTLYFLGHLQAPTSSERTINTDNIHPFVSGNYICAHNGVLTNFEDLLKTHSITNHQSRVDSSIIPRLIDKYVYQRQLSPVDAIKTVLQEINGTYSLWLYDKGDRSVYFARLSSTVFYDTVDISSVKTGNMIELPEYKIYKLDLRDNKLTIVSEFSAVSHFFTL